VDGIVFGHPSAICEGMDALWPASGGLSYARLESGGIQWPCPTPDHPGTRFLYGDAFPLGKARFVAVSQGESAAELPDPDYPFVLNTGRLLYHWHGGTLTRRVQGLLELAPRLEIAVNPGDARRLGGETGAPVRVISRRGELGGYGPLTRAGRAGAAVRPVGERERAPA